MESGFLLVLAPRTPLSLFHQSATGQDMPRAPPWERLHQPLSGQDFPIPQCTALEETDSKERGCEPTKVGTQLLYEASAQSGCHGEPREAPAGLLRVAAGCRYKCCALATFWTAFNSAVGAVVWAPDERKILDSRSLHSTAESSVKVRFLRPFSDGVFRSLHCSVNPVNAESAYRTRVKHAVSGGEYQDVGVLRSTAVGLAIDDHLLPPVLPVKFQEQMICVHQDLHSEGGATCRLAGMSFRSSPSRSSAPSAAIRVDICRLKSFSVGLTNS
jgi:hypothetical protein